MADGSIGAQACRCVIQSRRGSGTVAPREHFITTRERRAEADDRPPGGAHVPRTDRARGYARRQHVGGERNRSSLPNLNERRSGNRVGAGRTRLGEAEQHQVGPDRGENIRDHADHSGKFVERLKRRTGGA